MEYGFVSFGVRVIRNANSINAAGNVGNTVALQQIPVVFRNEEGKHSVAMVPVRTGNHIKHWHAVFLAREVEAAGRRDLLSKVDYEAQRRYPDSPQKDRDRNVETKKKGKSVEKVIITYTDLAGNEHVLEIADVVNGEKEFIRRLVIGDLHGFLFPAMSIARESTLKFSFALPVEEMVREFSSMLSERIVHNRVWPGRGGESETKGQMLFYRYYASAIYGFRIDFDVARVGVPYTMPSEGLVYGEDEFKERVKRAINATEALLYYDRGANASRALPVSKLIDLAILVSKRPLGIPHPYYEDRKDEAMRLVGIMKDAKLIAFGEGREKNENVIVVDSPKEAFEKLKELLGLE